jgi:hypothetical protein
MHILHGLSFTVNDQVALVEQALTELHNLVNDSDEYDADVADRLQFLSEQISLLFMKQKRYSYVFISVALVSLLCRCLYIIGCVTQY